MSKKTIKPEKAASTQFVETDQPRPELQPEMNSDVVDQEDLAMGTPSLDPPEAGIFAQGDVSAQAWFNSKKISGLWVSNNNKNAYVHITGVGWVKLNDTNADSILAMYMISGSARQGNNNVNYRKESDNKIHEIYCW